MTGATRREMEDEEADVKGRRYDYLRLREIEKNFYLQGVRKIKVKSDEGDGRRSRRE